jgi:hypothetical protein
MQNQTAVEFIQGMTGEQTNRVHAVISKKALEAGIALAA